MQDESAKPNLKPARCTGVDRSCGVANARLLHCTNFRVSAFARRHTIEKFDHTRFEGIFGTYDEQFILLDELLEQLRAVAQMIRRHPDVGTYGFMNEMVVIANYIRVHQHF